MLMKVFSISNDEIDIMVGVLEIGSAIGAAVVFVIRKILWLDD